MIVLSGTCGTGLTVQCRGPCHGGVALHIIPEGEQCPFKAAQTNHCAFGWYRSCMPKFEHSLTDQCAATAMLTFCLPEAKARKVFSAADGVRWGKGAYRSLMTYTRPHSGLMSWPCACFWSICCACCSTCMRCALLKCSNRCRAEQLKVTRTADTHALKQVGLQTVYRMFAAIPEHALPTHPGLLLTFTS